MQKLFFVILVIALSGCISKKTAVKENVKQDVVENVDKLEKETENHNSHADTVKEVKTNVTDKSVTRTTETEYSQPDSTGRQHITRERTTETLNDIAIINEENERIIIGQRSEIERLAVDNSELRSRLEASHREETKTSTKAPVWTYIVTFIIGAGISLILRSWIKGIFKRYRVSRS